MLAGVSALSYLDNGAEWMAGVNGFYGLMAPMTFQNSTSSGTLTGFIGLLGLAGVDIGLALSDTPKDRVYWTNFIGLNVVGGSVMLADHLERAGVARKQTSPATAPRITFESFSVALPPVQRWSPSAYIMRHEPGYAYTNRFEAPQQALTLHVHEMHADTALTGPEDLASWARRSIESTGTPLLEPLVTESDTLSGVPCVRLTYAAQAGKHVLRVRDMRFMHPRAPRAVLQVSWGWVLKRDALPVELAPEDLAILDTVNCWGSGATE